MLHDHDYRHNVNLLGLVVPLVLNHSEKQIQHGIGINSKPIPAKLKSYINLWLPTLPQVIACHSAHKSHGGLASTYVMMKKNPQQKLINREKHAKRFSN